MSRGASILVLGIGPGGLMLAPVQKASLSKRLIAVRRPAARDACDSADDDVAAAA